MCNERDDVTTQAPEPDSLAAQRYAQEPSTRPSARQMERWLIARISSLSGISAAEIDIREPFAFYGLNSSDAVGLSAELGDWLGSVFSPTLTFDYPSIEALVNYLAALR